MKPSERKKRIEKWTRNARSLVVAVEHLIDYDDTLAHIHAMLRAVSEFDDERRKGVTRLWEHYLLHAYTGVVAAGIRRLVDSDKRSVSLDGLLRSMADGTSLLTRKAFVDRAVADAFYPLLEQAAARADASFSALAGGQQAMKIESRELLKREKRLIRRTRSVREFVTKAIAHHDSVGPSSQRVIHVRKALQVAVAELRFVCTCLQVPGPVTQVPKRQEWWYAAFRAAWLPPRGPPPRHNSLFTKTGRPRKLRSS